MHGSRIVWLVPLLLGVIIPCGADTIDFFGLEHSPIGNSTVATNDYSSGLLIGALEFDGADGVSTALGEADSGAFFFPTADSVQSGYFMRADAYGFVDGASDKLIGVVSGYRSDYATFFASADFSSIGATSHTYQVWYGNLLLREATVTGGQARLYAEYSQDVRVNPWWRQPNGEHGALIEFLYPPFVMLPDCTDPLNCGSVPASRIFIRPNGATGAVTSVSRTDVYGGGGLPSFGFKDVRLGMFGHAHAALGSIRFGASNSVLRVVNLEPDSDNQSGTLVQLDHASTVDVQLLPLDVALPYTMGQQEQVFIDLSGTPSGSYVQYLGNATLQNSNGVLRLSAFLNEKGPLALNVYSNGALVGVPNIEAPSIIEITGAPRLAGVSANADTFSTPAGFALTFDAPATIQTSQGSLIGDRVSLVATGWVGVADLTGIAITTTSLPEFTITSESSSSTVPSLSISRSNNVVYLRWPDPAGAYRLDARTEPPDGWFPVQSTASHENGCTTVSYDLAESSAGILFFRLSRYIKMD